MGSLKPTDIRRNEQRNPMTNNETNKFPLSY